MNLVFFRMIRMKVSSCINYNIIRERWAKQIIQSLKNYNNINYKLDFIIPST